MPWRIATSARVVIPGVPPNWANGRGHSIVRDLDKARWRDLAWMLAQSARHDAHWPLPVKTDPPGSRWLEVEIHKRRPLYDDDGAVACLKPLIDGCFQAQGGTPSGVLAWDDSSAWLALVTPPCDMQRTVELPAQERVVFVVHLVDPRPAAATA